VSPSSSASRRSVHKCGASRSRRLDVAALCQGLILGTFVQGFTFDGTRLLSGPLGFVTPFSVITAPAWSSRTRCSDPCWLILKGEGSLKQWARERARILLPLVLAAIAIVCVWTPIEMPAIRERWFGWPNLIMLSPIRSGPARSRTCCIGYCARIAGPTPCRSSAACGSIC